MLRFEDMSVCRNICTADRVSVTPVVKCHADTDAGVQLKAFGNLRGQPVKLYQYF